jgi:hypothetical protein
MELIWLRLNQTASSFEYDKKRVPFSYSAMTSWMQEHERRIHYLSHESLYDMKVRGSGLPIRREQRSW